MAFSPDGSRLASTGGRTVRIWDVPLQKLLRTYAVDAAFVTFLPDGNTVMSGGIHDEFIRFWDVTAEQLPQSRACETLKLHTGRVYSIASLAASERWVSTGQDGKVIVSEPLSSILERKVDHSASDFCFVPGGRELAIASADGVHLVNAATESLTATLPSDESDWCSVAVSPDGKLLAAGNLAGTTCIWDLPMRSERIRWAKDGHIANEHLAFSPDGSQLAGRTWEQPDDATQVFDTATGELVHAFPAEACRAAIFSPDGTRLAMDSQNDVLVWDVASRQVLRTLRGHTSSVTTIAFSPDGRLVATGGNDRTVRLWDSETGQLQFTLEGHRDDVMSIAFSPDGRSLATADCGGCVKLWHVATGRELLELVNQPTWIKRVAFSDDGKRLAYLLKTGSVRIIHVPEFETTLRDSSMPAK